MRYSTNSRYVISSVVEKSPLLYSKPNQRPRGFLNCGYASVRNDNGKQIRLREILRFALNDKLEAPFWLPIYGVRWNSFPPPRPRLLFVDQGRHKPVGRSSKPLSNLSFRHISKFVISSVVEKSPLLYSKPNQRPRGFLNCGYASVRNNNGQQTNTTAGDFSTRRLRGLVEMTDWERF